MERAYVPPAATSPVQAESLGDAKSSALALAVPMTVAVDWMAIVAGAGGSLLVWRACGRPGDRSCTSQLISFCVLYGIGFVLLGMSENLYRKKHSLLRVLESSAVLRVSVFSFLLSYISICVTMHTQGSLLLLGSWLLATPIILLLRQVTQPLISRYSAADVSKRRVLIVGSGSEARRLFSYLIHSPDQELRPVGFLDEQSPEGDRVIYSHGYRFKEHAPVHCGPLDEALLARLEISDLFLADPHMGAGRRAEIATLASAIGIQISDLGPMHPSGHRGPSFVQFMDGLVVRSFFRGKAASLHAYEGMKRVIDFVFALCVVVVTLPLWVAIAIWIKSSSSGPVFFKQERIGRYGRPFGMYKFRSMYTTAPKYGRSPEDSRDPRITPSGRFLRKTSLDELPQLLNVLQGEMALVGPRPEMPYVVDQYTPYEAQRLSVLPGITGFWQLSADRKFVIHESLEYDLYYIENRGFFLDLAVMLHTLIFAMKGI
ncbi:MAG TPA: exopolysaccharide biosynthesis polyprenyl glycosylphosphotransferase [Edaphobacter sp.]|jgi:exopolysaccharide biosynthesis polyprenyl glycosylphosphotransferase|nr:exopolysaccharide biosynthesis polyprenyl glycosylphosphotransferase [Edaphobacter sp.]